MKTIEWNPVGRIAPGELADARLAAHYAAQPLAAAAYALLPTPPDHTHSNLLWSEERSGFVGRDLGRGVRGFLDVAGLRVGLVAAGDSGQELGALALAGLSLSEAMGAMGDLLVAMGFELPEGGLQLPEYDLPGNALADGGVFADPASFGGALDELARWYTDGQLALARVAKEHLGGAEVRLWPHHFDLAALRTLDEDADPEEARSIGVGFSPGDGTYSEPYFYVSPWPAPPANELPELERHAWGGPRWHTEGFTSAVLHATDVVKADSGSEQGTRVRAALEGAVGASERLLGD